MKIKKQNKNSINGIKNGIKFEQLLSEMKIFKTELQFCLQNKKRNKILAAIQRTKNRDKIPLKEWKKNEIKFENPVTELKI